MKKASIEELKKHLEVLDESRRKIAVIFLNDFLNAKYAWERKVYKARLLNFVCKEVKRKGIEVDSDFCKRLKAILDSMG